MQVSRHMTLDVGAVGRSTTIVEVWGEFGIIFDDGGCFVRREVDILFIEVGIKDSMQDLVETPIVDVGNM